MEKSFEILEFDKIRKMLQEYAMTNAAKELCTRLTPALSQSELSHRQRETTEARILLDKAGQPPLMSLSGIRDSIRAAVQGQCLSVEELEQLEQMLAGIGRLKSYLGKTKYLEAGLSYYDENLEELPSLRGQIGDAVRNGRIDDKASRYLESLRKEIQNVDGQIRKKAESVLRSHKAWTAEAYVTIKNGRLCIPIKKEHRGRLAGTVVTQSATGSTLFIEPEAVGELAEKLSSLQFEEENEERRIRYELSALAAENESVFLENIATVEKLDFLFAKGKLSQAMEGIEPAINTERRIEIKQGRHPFIKKEECVPLDLKMGGDLRGVIITGPNTGGKTVSIKTAGLLSLMAQSGLHVPCRQANLAMNSQVLCDIGDGQSISENLSTFSAHLTNTIRILEKVNGESLVIMDELGSGTDPAEGMGIAMAILERLRQQKCLFLVTTHYPEIKTYAKEAVGVINYRKAFDRESLKPLYRLEMGAAGESCALYIAKKLGMPEDMLAYAEKAAYEGLPPGPLTSGRKQPPKAGPQIQKHRPQKSSRPFTSRFQRGDSVKILPEGKIGIICIPDNEKGIAVVQLPSGKEEINQKRLRLHIKAEELYPEDYDFSIIFDTVENRKARHKMGKKHQPGLIIQADK